MSTDFKISTRSSVERYSTALVDLSRSIHAEPEIAFQEHRSADKVASLLAGEGFEVERGVAQLDTAFTATYGDGDLVLGLCVEYDALPGIGHACGHNVIAAASTGAALALRDLADRLGVTVKVIGTPAEEVGGGKVLMLERGVFDDVSFSMMVHPAPYESCAAKSLAITDLEVHYKGKPSHAAAAPHLGINAADAVTVAQISISLLRQHLEPGQMVTGIVTHGGTVPNVIPARASAMFDVRAENLESLQRLENRIQDCFSAGALATGCTHEVVQVSPIYAELTPDPWLADAYRRTATELGRRPLSPEQEQREKIGSTDMGNVTRVLPAIHPTIAIDCGDAVNHQQEFATACASASADRAVLEGALAMAWTTIATASDSQQRARLLARGGAA